MVLFDVENCGYCRHRFVMPIGLDINEIHKYNTKVVKAHNEKMKEWTNTPSKKRSAKPRPAKALSQHLVCMCCKMACMDNTNGSGCLKCETACRNAIEQDSEIRPFFTRTFNVRAKFVSVNVALFTSDTNPKNCQNRSS